MERNNVKIPLKLAKFIYKRELKIIMLECEKRSNTCHFTANMSSTADDGNYLRGKATAYNEMKNFLEKEILKINEVIK